MRIKRIEPAGFADVYNMEVDDTHDFAVGSGVIAHNCYDEWRYICMSRPIPPRKKVLHKEWTPPPEDPLNIMGGGNSYIDPFDIVRI